MSGWGSVEVSKAHASVLAQIAATIAKLHSDRIIRIAIDGVDGAGKTTLADALAPVVAARGRPTIRASVDDFHHPRAVRYARGRYSPEGHYLDSYDYAAFSQLLLDPLGPDGSGRYLARCFDLDNDEPFDVRWQQAPPTAVLIVDGIFLHRPELRPCWDLSIFLQVDFDVSVPRGALRCPARDSADPAAPLNQRYVGGQKLYSKQCAPQQQADIVIDYNNLRDPKILKWLSDARSNP